MTEYEPLGEQGGSEEPQDSGAEAFLHPEAYLFAEDIPSPEAARELAGLHRVTSVRAFVRYPDFIDTDDYGDRKLDGLELEYERPGAPTSLITVWSNRTISVAGRNPDGRWAISDYYRDNKGVVRYDRAPAAEMPRRGEIPLRQEWERVRESQLRAAPGRHIEEMTGLNFHQVGEAEALYVFDMVNRSRPRRVALEQLERVFLRRERSNEPPSETDSEHGAADFTRYIQAFLRAKGFDPLSASATNLKLTTLSPDGKMIDSQVGERRDGVGDKVAFASITGDWDLGPKWRRRFARLTKGEQDYLKARMNLDYGVRDSGLRVIKNLSIESIHGEVLHVFKPSVIRGDQLEARLVRNFIANPAFNRRRLRTRTT